MNLLALFSAQVRYCALPYLPTNLNRSELRASNLAARQMASTLRSYQTEHFVIWWSLDDPVHKILSGSDQVLPGDSIPEMVRVCSAALEMAWKTYVDSLHYLPPMAASQSFLWAQTVPAGKYPVEICNIANALSDTINKYFGVAYPDDGLGHSMLMLASNLTSFGDHPFHHRDLDGTLVGMNYATQWREPMRATCAHELFHAVQFNYERALKAHGFFEASAVAMESRLVPESKDYLQFCSSLVELQNQVPFPAGIADDAYPEGWQVRSMMTDLGPNVVKALWESRKATLANSPPFLSTLRQVLPQFPFRGSFDTQLVRHSMRVALTGKRSDWHPTEMFLFPDAAYFPPLTGSLPHKTTATALPLALGGIQVILDTVAPTEDRVFVWIPDEGVLMGHATSSPNQSHVAWLDGSVRVAKADAPRSVWTFANPGNPPALRAFAHSDSSLSHYAMIAAGPRIAAHAGQAWSWTSTEGLVLSGASRSEAQTTPLLHLDVWRPWSAKDPFGASVANSSQGHVLVLEDADRLLSLSSATLRMNGILVNSAYGGTGDGIWRPLAVSQSGNSSVISLGELDLAHPLRILASSGNAPGAASLGPRPNPSRQGAPVWFPISGATGQERLDILAADGGLVRELFPQPGQHEIVWDLRNRENRMVRPGVYWYVWSGSIGSNRGRLLVAD